MQHPKPYRLMRRKTLSEAAIMRQWAKYNSYWTKEEAEIWKAKMEAKGYECKIVED